MEIILISFGVQKFIAIEEQSNLAAARRAAVALATQLAFDETKSGQLALAVTEAATNIIKHAGSGYLLISPIDDSESVAIEIIAVDAGPGIANIDFHMIDGNSTTGTYGLGLGSIQRLANEFDIYTKHGTALRFVVWKDRPLQQSPWQCGAVCVPITGEEACGDAWCAVYDGNRLTLAVADGLGHGPDAALAANAAMKIVQDNAEQNPQTLIGFASKALHGTRGAALAITQIDEEKSRLGFAGIGNIAATLFKSEARHHLVSHSGIVGTPLRKIQEFSHETAPGIILIVHSDGLATRWDLDQYPDIRLAHPSLIAAILFRDFARGRDDATVVVLHHQAVN